MIKDTERFSFGRLGETPIEEVLQKRATLRDELASGQLPVPCRGCTVAEFALMSRREYAQFRLARLRLRRSMSQRSEGGKVSLPIIDS